jgi:ornithine--oxo-acid transaminase
MSDSRQVIADTERVSAPNYAPLPVVIARGEGVWVWDEEGRKYLDCISAYSSLNQGHRHPRIVAALVEQAGRLTLTSRAVHNDRMGVFLNELCALAGFDMALPMNTGAEAVETAIKLARKWGYRTKGVPHDRAAIVVCRNNFHGRTTTIVGFSSEQQYREDFGPFTPGFTLVDFGDLDALRAAITPNTVAFLAELPPDRVFDMPFVVGRCVDIDLNNCEIGILLVLVNPFGGDECVRVGICPHDSPPNVCGTRK